jgi:rubredoxin
MEWMWDEFCSTCQEYYEEINNASYCPECESIAITSLLDADGYCPECNWNKDNAIEQSECVDHEKLLGNWKKDDEGYYEPNTEGEYAAILTSSTFNRIQVVWSKHTERHGLCSPCFPGQADIDSNGEYLCYVLPKDLMEE